MVSVSQFSSSANEDRAMQLHVLEEATKWSLFCQITTLRSGMSFYAQEHFYSVTEDGVCNVCNVNSTQGWLGSSSVMLLYSNLKWCNAEVSNFGRAKML